MAEDFGESIPPEVEGGKKDNKIWVIIAVVIIVLCCCCLIAGWGTYWLWNNGDRLLGLAAQFSNLLI